MKLIIPLLALSLFAADPPPQVDADKLALVESQRNEANATINFQNVLLSNPPLRDLFFAMSTAQQATARAIEARAKRLGCPGKLDLTTLDCPTEAKK